MHAYDYDQIRNHHIIVRTARENEVLKTFVSDTTILLLCKSSIEDLLFIMF